MGNKWSGGEISFQFESNEGYRAGDVCVGTIEVNTTKPFEAKALMLSLIGMEHHQTRSEGEDGTYYNN